MIPRSRSSTLLLATIATVVLGGLSSPSRAFAECGSYVVYTNPADAAKNGMTKHECTGPNCPHSLQSSQNSPPKPTGCHGPNCRENQPVPPMQEPPAKLRTLGDEVNLPIASDDRRPGDSFPSHVDSALGESLHQGSDVYHPPR